MPGQAGLVASALAMKKLGYTETGVARFFRIRYCATRKVDLEISY